MRTRGRTAFIVTYLAPAVLLYGIFVIWPVIQAVGFSFFKWSGLSSKKTYVGFDNFKQLFHDNVFWQALQHNATIFLFGGAAILIVGIAVAHAMQGEGRLTRALRSVYLFPNIMSLVVVAILWEFVYDPHIGLVTSLVKLFGGSASAKPGAPIVDSTILGSPTKALPAVIITFVWFAVGFYIMLFSAGIRQIPQEVAEASKLDGAEGFFRFRKITLPLLWSVGRIAVIYLVINTLNVFALVFLMTQGGPDRKTEVMLTYLYEQAFVNSDYGAATALAIANFIIVMAVSGIVLRITRKDPSESVQ
jgi:N-acetylglucosamine transport system permease protein